MPSFYGLVNWLPIIMYGCEFYVWPGSSQVTLYPSTYEERMRWYRLACTAIFAIPLLMCLSLPGVSSGLSRDGRLAYVIVESLLAACLGLLAARVRDGSGQEPDAGVQFLPAIRSNLAELGKRGVHLGEMGDALQRNEEGRVPAATAQGRGRAQSKSKTAEAQTSSLNGFDNSALARRMELENARLRAVAVTVRTTERHTPILASINEQAAAKPSSSLAKEDVQALFRALARGTAKRLGRDPSTEELARLVEAWSEIENPPGVLEAARENTVSVHWEDERWVFETTP